MKKNKTICQLIIGYRGMIDLARRSGQIESITAHVIHQGDTFDLDYGQDTVVHKPKLDGAPGPMIAVWARAHLVGGGTQTVVMTKFEVDAIRGRSRASNFGPWVTDYEEMAKKTIIRRLFKLLPASIQMVKASSLDGYRAGENPADSVVFDAKEAEFEAPSEDEPGDTIEGEVVTRPPDAVEEDPHANDSVKPEDPAAAKKDEPATPSAGAEDAALEKVCAKMRESKTVAELELSIMFIKENLHGKAHIAAKQFYAARKKELSGGAPTDSK